MGRGVMTPTGSVVDVYMQLPEDFDGDFGWDDLKEDLRGVIQRRLPSLTEEDGWTDRECSIILGNGKGRVTIAEYCGTVAVSLAVVQPKYGYWDDDREREAAERWCGKVSDTFRKTIERAFPGLTMTKVGTFSNGCPVYAKAGGSLGMGFVVERGEHI